jgi:hypothetical protein
LGSNFDRVLSGISRIVASKLQTRRLDSQDTSFRILSEGSIRSPAAQDHRDSISDPTRTDRMSQISRGPVEPGQTLTSRDYIRGLLAAKREHRACVLRLILVP